MGRASAGRCCPWMRARMMSRTLHTCTQPSCLTVATSHGGVGRGGSIPRWQRAQDLLSSVNLIFACKYDQDENCVWHRYLSGWWWWLNLNLTVVCLFPMSRQVCSYIYMLHAIWSRVCAFMCMWVYWTIDTTVTTLPFLSSDSFAMSPDFW